MPSKKIVIVTFPGSVRHSPKLTAPTRKHLKGASVTLQKLCDQLSNALDKRKKLGSQFDDSFKIVAIANALEKAMQLQEIVNKVCTRSGHPSSKHIVQIAFQSVHNLLKRFELHVLLGVFPSDDYLFSANQTVKVFAQRRPNTIHIKVMN